MGCMLLFLGGYAQDPDTIVEPVETVTNAFDWTDFITGIVSLALGAWAGRTQFADKTGKEKAKWKGKVDKLDELIDDVLRDIRNNTFTKEGVKAHLEKGKEIIKRPE